METSSEDQWPPHQYTANFSLLTQHLGNIQQVDRSYLKSFLHLTSRILQSFDCPPDRKPPVNFLWLILLLFQTSKCWESQRLSPQISLCTHSLDELIHTQRWHDYSWSCCTLSHLYWYNLDYSLELHTHVSQLHT